MNHTTTAYTSIEEAPRKQTATSLAVSKALSEHNPEGILVVDTVRRNVLEANGLLGNLFNFDPCQLINRPAEEACRILSSALYNSGAFAERFYYYLDIPESGGCFDIRPATVGEPTVVVYVTPIRNQRSEVVAKLWSFHDVSTQRVLEQGLREAQQLETNARLAAGIVHDSNNLLTVIIAQLYMAADQLRVVAEGEDLIEPAMDAAVKCGGLLKTVLNLAREQEGHFEVLDWETVLKEVEVLVRAIAPATISIHTHFEVNLPRVHANPMQLHQVMMNLVFNAIDAMPGGGNLYISLTRQGDDVCLTVKDSGEGMPAHTVKRIFDAFYTTKEKGKGTGLGLHMVAGIVKTHNGTIHCDSEPGAGTTFRIALPMRDPEKAGRPLFSQAALSQVEAVSS